MSKMDNLEKYEEDVKEVDRIMDIRPSQRKLTTFNMMNLTLCMLGEAGEFANVVKKMVRNGATPELWKNFDEELADIMVYFMIILIVSGIDFDEAWEDKIEVLKSRAGRLRNQRLEDEPLRR